MQTMMMRIKTIENMQLDDDKFVEECMHSLMTRYPQITDYIFERVGEKTINIMFWGKHLRIEAE